VIFFALNAAALTLYLLQMNPRGNHEKFPKLPDGSRDLVRDRSHVDTYKDLEKLLKSGKVKAIGVSNYSKRYLEELLPKVSIVPAVNQIENHPLLPQQDVVDFCKEKGILVTAYSPLGSTGSPLFEDPHVVKLAEQKGVSPGTILLSYHIARGVSVVPKSVTPSRIEDNKKTVKLSESDLASLAEISKNGVTRYIYPEFGVDFGFPDKS
jgi:glycerol 2-dehydrogenase (NADP+)